MRQGQITILLSFSVLLTTPLSAQHTFGLKFAGGISKITTDNDRQNPSSQITARPAVSGQAGLFYNYLGDNTYLFGSEVLFNQVEGRTQIKNPVGNITGNGQQEFAITNAAEHISYLSFPAYFGYRINNVVLNLGFQLSFVLMRYGHWQSTRPHNGTMLVLESRGRLNIDGFDYGPRFGIMYKASKRIDLEAVYYYGTNNIHYDGQYDFLHTAPSESFWKVRQLTIGLRYNFLMVDNLGRRIKGR